MLGFSADRLRSFLFHQGLLDEHFLQLLQLQDDASPNFVYHESEKLLTNLRLLLMEERDYKKVGIKVKQMMGSSSSIGAKRVTNVCLAFRAASDLNNRHACLGALELLEHEYCYLKNKLHLLFQIEQQRLVAAGIRYPIHHH